MEKASIVVAHKSKDEVEVLYVGTDYRKALEVLKKEQDDVKQGLSNNYIRALPG